MLFFDQFQETAVEVQPDQPIGPGVALVYGAASAMTCTLRRSFRQGRLSNGAPTLVIAGKNRAPDDWFGIEITVPATSQGVAITARNYPVHRLFPRVHFEVLGKTEHLDLADVAASDSFATRYFDAAEWQDAALFRDCGAETARLTLLIPSTPWFVMEVQEITVDGGRNA